MLPPGIEVCDLRLDPSGRAGHYLHVPTGEVISANLPPETALFIPAIESAPVAAMETTLEISPLQQSVDLLQGRVTALELQVAELLAALTLPQEEQLSSPSDPTAETPKPDKADKPAKGSDDAKSAS